MGFFDYEWLFNSTESYFFDKDPLFSINGPKFVFKPNIIIYAPIESPNRVDSVPHYQSIFVKINYIRIFSQKTTDYLLGKNSDQEVTG